MRSVEYPCTAPSVFGEYLYINTRKLIGTVRAIQVSCCVENIQTTGYNPPELYVGRSLRFATDNKLAYYNYYCLIYSVDNVVLTSVYGKSSVKLETVL
jgi:hypothetical protein